MVAVAAVVMHPGGAVPEFLPLGVIGAVIALKIFGAGPELHRGVFGQVVGQTLPVEPQAEAVFPYQCPMVIDSFQMAPEIQGQSPPTRNLPISIP